MTKPIMYILIAVLVIGAGYAFYQKNHPNNSNNPNNSSTDQLGTKMPFDAFIRRGDGSYVCTVSQAMSDMENKGTVYIAGSADVSKRKMRGEFSTIAEGMKVDSVFIIKDGFNYSWNSMMPKSGFKIAIPKESVDANGNAVATQNGNSGTYAWSASQIGAYDCQAWTVDETKFVLPAGMTFKEMK
jgi:hypothetical protein